MTDRMIIGIHGYNFNFSQDQEANNLYDIWSDMLDTHVYPWHWQSKFSFLQTLKANWNEKGRKFTNAYQLAQDKAIKEGHRVGNFITEMNNTMSDRPISIICHSLGSRVALEACLNPHTKIDCVLILGGSEYSKIAYPVAQYRPDIQFHNIFSKDDFTLEEFGYKYGEKMREDLIGRHGFQDLYREGFKDLDNWNDIEIQDNDHDDYYESHMYWPKWKEILNG